MAASKIVHQCDICSEDSQIATGYCEDCDEHLCDDCFNYHKKPKKFRDHIVFRIHETGRQIRRRECDITGETCKVHGNYFVEFYCEDHNQVGCANCQLIDHKQCEKITFLKEINQDVLCSSHVNDCRSALLELNQDTDAIESEVRQNDKKWQECNSECQHKMEQFRHEIDEKVDKLQTSLTYEVKNASDQNSQNLNSTSGSCEVIKVQIKQRISKIESYIENGHACRMYVALRGLNEDIVSIRNELRKTNANNHVKFYTFKPDRQLQSSIFEDVERFGTMEEVVDGSDKGSGVETMVHNIFTKKEMIDDLQQQLRVKTMLVDKYEQQLREKNKLADMYEQQLREKTMIADKGEEQLREKTKLADKYEQQLSEKTKVADQSEHKLREKTKLANKYEQQLSEKTKLADKYEQQLSEKTKLADQSEQQLREKTKLADKYEQQLSEKTKLADKYEQQLSEKTKMADQSEQQVKDVTMDLDKRIKDTDKTIEYLRGEQRMEKNKLVEENEQALKDVTLKMEANVKAKEKMIDDLQQQLRVKTTLVDKYEQQLREKNKLADMYEQQLREKTMIADKGEEQLREKTKLADKYEQQLSEKTKVADQSEHKLREKTKLANKYEQQLSEKTKLADKYEQQLSEKTKLADQSEQQLREKTKLADKYEQQLSEKTKLADKYEQQLSEKTKMADQSEQQVKDVTMDLDKRIKDTDKTIEYLRGEQRMEKNKLVEENEQALKDVTLKMEANVKAKEKIIDDIQKELREKTRLAENYLQEWKIVTIQLEERINGNANPTRSQYNNICGVCKQTLTITTSPPGNTRKLLCGHVFCTGCAVQLIKAKRPCTDCGIVTDKFINNT